MKRRAAGRRGPSHPIERPHSETVNEMAAPAARLVRRAPASARPPPMDEQHPRTTPLAHPSRVPERSFQGGR